LSVAIIADSHLGGPGGPAAPLIAQLEALPGQGATRLVLLGDIFQAWIGFERFETPDIAAVVPVLKRLRAQGLRIDYLEGNRDFFLAKSRYRDAFDFVGTEVDFEAGGKRYLAVHGDGLDANDRAYRFWRGLSKNRVSRFFANRIPRPVAHRLVHSTERRLSQTNFKHKIRIPEEVIRAYGEHRLAEGYDVLVLGHFHEPRVWQVPGGEIRLLEAWFTSKRVEWMGS
jgi:UDP-2,3-diacylglucosamine hydrolase